MVINSTQLYMHNEILFNHSHFHRDSSYMAKFLAGAETGVAEGQGEGIVTTRSAAEGIEIMSLDNFWESEDFNDMRRILHSTNTHTAHFIVDLED